VNPKHAGLLSANRFDPYAIAPCQGLDFTTCPLSGDRLLPRRVVKFFVEEAAAYEEPMYTMSKMYFHQGIYHRYLILKVQEIIFFTRVKHMMGHFKGFFEKSLETPHYMFCPRQKIISRTFKTRGTLVFLCPWGGGERECETNNERKRERERERQRETERHKEGTRERVRARARERERERDRETDRKTQRGNKRESESKSEREQELESERERERERERTKVRTIFFLNHLGQNEKSAKY
jgi:hypothetical protein